MKTIIGVNGACGRMGQRIIQLAHEDNSLTIGAALEAAGHPRLGQASPRPLSFTQSTMSPAAERGANL